jgi:hypothetical protein
MKKIVAFLQNPWFKPGTPNHVIGLYRDSPNYRRKIIQLSTSGRKLKSAFGPYFDEIYWDNASPQHWSSPNCLGCPDLDHMEAVLKAQQPSCVLLFGGVAGRGYEFVLANCRALYDLRIPDYRFPHPNAKGLTQHQLNEFAREVILRHLQ